MDIAPRTFAAPTCPICVMRLDIAGSEKHPHFFCPSCDLAFLSRAQDFESHETSDRWELWGS